MLSLPPQLAFPGMCYKTSLNRKAQKIDMSQGKQVFWLSIVLSINEPPQTKIIQLSLSVPPSIWYLSLFICPSSVNLSFHQLAILSTCQFINLLFCQINIKSFYQLLKWHFAKLPFCLILYGILGTIYIRKYTNVLYICVCMCVSVCVLVCTSVCTWRKVY